jgi:hypothetical protein
MEYEEILKIIFAIVVAVLFYLFKSKPAQKENKIPEKFNPPVAQIQNKADVIEKVVSFEDILKKFEQNAPKSKMNIIPQSEMITARPAQLKKMLKEREVKLDANNNSSLMDMSVKKPLLKEKEIEEVKEMPTKREKTQLKEIYGHKDEISTLKKELQRYREYEEKKEVKNEALIKMIKNPQSVRQAFILSEIFNKKW